MIDLDSPAALNSLPSKSAVYRVWYQDQVVYVGQTTNLKKRWQSHHIYPKLISEYGLGCKLDWVLITPENLARAESFAYRHFKPALNQRDPVSQLGGGF